RRALPPHDQRAPPGDRGRDRGRRCGHGRRRDVRPPRVPAPVLRARLAPLAVTSFGIQGSGQLVGGAPDPGVFREVAVRAEELGYDSIWAGDHISYRNPILDVVVALSTFAAVTKRITVAAGIVLLPLRHPSVVAKEFASLDYASGGRTILGVGVGGEGEKDFEAVG